MNNKTLYIFHEFDHWDDPITGLGYYNNQLVWFDIKCEFEYDPITKEPLSTEQLHQRLAKTQVLWEDFRVAMDNGNEQLEEHLSEQLDLIEPQSTRTYTIYRLSPLDKVCLMWRMYVFHFFVGTHWTYDHRGYRRGPFRMNRWLGLGKVLFKLYFSSKNTNNLKHEERRKDKFRRRPVINEVRLDQDVQFGKPQRNKHARN